MQTEKPDLSNNLERNEIQMPILNHQFREFFFHPSKANTLICLEFNKNPDKIDSYHLTSIDPEQLTQPSGATIKKTSTKLKQTAFTIQKLGARSLFENSPKVSDSELDLP